MAKVKIITPITVHNGRQYVGPGSEVELEEAEARRLIAAHGEFGNPGLKGDPANTQILNVMDAASLEQLNIQAEINGGHGVGAKSLNRRFDKPEGKKPEADPLPADSDLEAMKKDELTELAATRQVAIDSADTKAEIIAKLKASV
jgi:hypothetical protein